MTSSNVPPDHPQPNLDAIWAPWRLDYLEALDDDEAPTPKSGCFLTDYWNTPDQDEANHVIERTEHGMIMLNRYPYANGHLLVALGEGRPRLMDYEPAQRSALWGLVDRATALMEAAIEPQGINFGINQGRAAGAGVPQHLHAHLVPRWSGDVNFISTVGRVRVIPSALEQMAARYRSARDRLGGS